MTECNNRFSVVDSEVGPTTDTAPALSMLVDTITEKIKLQRAMSEAQLRDAALGGKAIGLLEGMGQSGDVDSAMKSNWRGLRDLVNEKLSNGKA